MSSNDNASRASSSSDSSASPAPRTETPGGEPSVYRHESSGERQLKYGLSVGVLIVALILIVGIINWFASQWDSRVDLTAHGQYTLSDQTIKLLDGLKDPITMTMMFAEHVPNMTSEQRAGVDAARGQVDSVLKEFLYKCDKLKVVKLDPTDVRTLTEFQALKKQLQGIFKDETDAYTKVIDDGRKAMETLKTFAQATAPEFMSSLAQVPADDSNQRMFQGIAQVLTNEPQEIDTLVKQIGQSMDVSTSQVKIFPDLQGALAVVRTVAQLRGRTMEQIADFCDSADQDQALPGALRDRLKGLGPQFKKVAEELNKVGDSVNDLKPLKSTAISSALNESNCVLLTTTDRASVVPFNKLFPPPSAIEAAQNAGRADRRFAGETVIAAGIRQLLMTEKPVVVLCHAERTPSIRTPSQQGTDLSVVSSQLADLGFEVREWNVNQGARPKIDAKVGKVAWVIVPPQPNMQSGGASANLANVTRQLISDGENVMVNIFPNMMGSFGQKDMWADVTAALGVTAKTSTVVEQQFPQPNDKDAYASQFRLTKYLSDNPISQAVQGELTFFQYAVPLELTSAAANPDAVGKDAKQETKQDEKAADDKNKKDSDAGKKPAKDPWADVNRQVLLEIKPTEKIFATDQWINEDQIKPPAVQDTEPYAIAVAMQRPAPGSSGQGADTDMQRCLIFGCGMWYYTAVTGTYELNSRLPVNPGNSDLFNASVCWLAQQDGLVARSPRADAIPHIEDLSAGALVAWRWFLLAGLPIACLAGGVAVWVLRRG